MVTKKKTKRVTKKKAKKEKLLSVLVEFDKDGYEKLRCPHCNSWDCTWLKGSEPQTVVCDGENEDGSFCGKKVIIPPLTSEERLKREETEKKRLEKKLNRSNDNISRLESRIRELENTPWNRAKKRYDEYRKKPRKLLEDFLESDQYLTTRMHLRRFLYRSPTVDGVRVFESTGKAGVTGVHLVLNVKPNRLGKKLGYPEFKQGYRKTKQYGWRRVPYFSRPEISKGFRSYLDKVSKAERKKVFGL